MLDTWPCVFVIQCDCISDKLLWNGWIQCTHALFQFSDYAYRQIRDLLHFQALPCAGTTLSITHASYYHKHWWQGTLLSLTYWDRDKLAAICQTICSNQFSHIKVLTYLIKFHWTCGGLMPYRRPAVLCIILQWNLSITTTLWDTSLPSGAHLVGQGPPRWAPEGRNY